jgi:hypothetical protein
MLKVYDDNTVQINSVLISVDSNNNVSISGHNRLMLESSGDVDIKGKKINLLAEDEINISSEKHIIEKAPRIDLNPDETDEDFIKHKEKLYARSM